VTRGPSHPFYEGVEGRIRGDPLPPGGEQRRNDLDDLQRRQERRLSAGARKQFPGRTGAGVQARVGNGALPIPLAPMAKAPGAEPALRRDGSTSL
jgi:hypothetical protein